MASANVLPMSSPRAELPAGLGARLSSLGADEQLLVPWLDAHAFRRLRIVAEHKARVAKREAGGGVEVNLDEIWAQFPENVLVEGAWGRMPIMELAVERRVTRPDLDILDLAAIAEEHGCSLLLVSNTYFTRQHLAQLFARPELEVFQRAKVFPSCAYGRSKGDGLWQAVLAEAGVPPARILHVGDEELSDVEAPSALGIRTLHFRRLPQGFETVLAREQALVPEPASPSPAVVHRWLGDYGIIGVRAKVLARIDTAELGGDLPVAWRYGAGVLGPVLTGFADWVHRQAVDLKAPKVWCMMREGELLADLVQRVADHRRSEVKAEPIWLSRHVTARAAITEVTESELRKLLVRRRPPTTAQFLRNLGLTPGEVPEFRLLAGRIMDSPEIVDQVVRGLVSNEHLKARILDESAQARRRLIAYVKSVVGDTEGPVPLVDLGWGGTIQAQLARVLEADGFAGQLVGLYMATNDTASSRILDGNEMRGYLTSCGVPEMAIHQITRSPEVVEQACLATSGSVVDFDDSGRPVREDSIPEPPQVISKLVAQHGIRAFQQEWLRYEGAVAGWTSFDGGERSFLLEVLSSSIIQPTVDEARVFGAWAHEDNFGAEDREHVVSERLGRFVPYLSPVDVAEMTTLDTYWPTGLAASYDESLSTAVTGLLTGQVSPRVFEASRYHPSARMWADRGAGFADPQTRPLRINGNGLSYLHFSVTAPGAISVRIDPCDHPAMFRIDWIDLTLKVEGLARPVHVRVEGAEELSKLVYVNCRHLYDGVAYAPTGEPSVHVPLGGRTPGPVYGIEAEVALAVMALPVNAAAPGFEAAPEGRMATAVARTRGQLQQGGAPAVAKGLVRVARRRLARLRSG
jgi:hypothetical protein